MKEDTKNWVQYSEENLEAARILLNSHLYNPALHNIQQSVEKALKSILIERGIKLKKSHSISELRNVLVENNIEVAIGEDECELLDAIYLPSKYPLGSALPNYSPDEDITKKCLSIAEVVLNDVRSIIE